MTGWRLALAAVIAFGTPLIGARVEDEGTGWSVGEVSLDVLAHPDSGTLRVSGRLTAVAPPGGSFGPTLMLAPNGMRFESVDAADGSISISSVGDSARVRFTHAVPAGQAVTVAFHLRAPRARLARSVAVGTDGAFASWFGNWYPWLAAAKGSDPATRAAGTLTLRIPQAWSGLASGRLTDSSSADGWRRERWESRQPLVWSFIAAPYHVTSHRVGATDVSVYLMPRQSGKAAAFARVIPGMVNTLEQAYGPYPFATFGVAAIPAGIAPPGIGGRSEMGYFLTHEHALDVDSVDVPLFAHELAHMWWGNTVLSDPPGDDMVDEGMASYGATLVMEARHGRVPAREYMREGSIANSAHTFFHLWRIGGDEPLMDDYATLPSYSKGAWVYEMLRDRVGDSLFFDTLRRLVRERAGRSTTLRDIRAAFVREAPPSADLERFFADWLDRPGAPVIDVRWSAATTDAGAPAARVTLVQRTAPYRLPLDVDVASRAGTRRVRVILRDSVQSFLLPARATPTQVRLDPEHHVMLWEPRFGVIPGVTATRTDAESRVWLRDELAWLRGRYGVGRVEVGIVRGRATERLTSGKADAAVWPLGRLAAIVERLGPRSLPSPPADIQALTALWSRMLAQSANGNPAAESAAIREITTASDSLAGDPFRATARSAVGLGLATKKGARRLSFVDVSGGRTLVLIGYPGSGQGCVIVMDSDRVGVGMATQIAQRLAMVERWPEYPGQD